MNINQHPDMLELQKRQSREAADKYEEFLRLHPELEGHLDGAKWTAQHTIAFREFTAPLLAKHKEERRALVAANASSGMSIVIWTMFNPPGACLTIPLSCAHHPNQAYTAQR